MGSGKANMFGGQPPSVENVQSPEQRQMLQFMMPMFAQMYGFEPTEAGGVGGAGGGGGGLAGAFDQLGFAGLPGGGAGGYEYTGAPWQPPAGLSPTADWYSNLSPDMMAGLQQPYMDAQRQGLELLGMGGAAGSARGGASGAAGAMTGEVMGQMAQNVPMQAWQMGADQRRASMLPYTGMFGMAPQTFGQPAVTPGYNPMMDMLGMGMMAYGIGK